MSKRIVAVNSNCYHGYSIEDALEGIAAAGFHYVELTATKGWTEHVFPDQSFETLCAVKDKLKELDLVPFSMSGHCNLMDTARLPDFVMNMRLANFFGCDYIVSSIGEAHLNVAQTEAYVEELLQTVQVTPPARKPGYIIKDVRLFLNSIRRSVQIMQQAGVDAKVDRQETEEGITVTVRIPKTARR